MSEVAQSCLTLCYSMDCSLPGFSIHGIFQARVQEWWVYSHSCPLSQWCSLTPSWSATFFPFCLQSFPASGSFPASQLFTLDGQSTGALASKYFSFSRSPSNEYAGLISFRIYWFDPLAVQGTLSKIAKEITERRKWFKLLSILGF